MIFFHYNRVRVLSQGQRVDKNRPYLIKFLECDEGWTKFDIGDQTQCYKNIGEFRADEAINACADYGASLPLPRNDEELEDFKLAIEAMQERVHRKILR